MRSASVAAGPVTRPLVAPQVRIVTTRTSDEELHHGQSFDTEASHPSFDNSEMSEESSLRHEREETGVSRQPLIDSDDSMRRSESSGSVIMIGEADRPTSMSDDDALDTHVPVRSISHRRILSGDSFLQIPQPVVRRR